MYILDSIYLVSYRCNWVMVNGDEYKPATGVILEVEHDLPIVGVIENIYLINGNEVMFHVKQFYTSFEPHYRAYILEDSLTYLKIVRHSTLFIHNPVHIRTSHNPELSHSFILVPFMLCTL